jgi:hypothetical protein
MAAFMMPAGTPGAPLAIGGPDVGEGLSGGMPMMRGMRSAISAATRGIGGPDITERLPRMSIVTRGVPLAIPCVGRGRNRRSNDDAARRQHRQ